MRPTLKVSDFYDKPDQVEVHVRKAVMEDKDNLIELQKQLVKESIFLRSNNVNPNDKARFEINRLNKYIDLPNYYLVLQVNDILVGVLRYKSSTDVISGEFGIGILKEYQRKGYGRLMINTLIALLRKDQVAKYLYLTVDNGNLIAKKLYELMGFKFYTKQGANKSRMVLNLSEKAA